MTCLRRSFAYMQPRPNSCFLACSEAGPARPRLSARGIIIGGEHEEREETKTGPGIDLVVWS